MTTKPEADVGATGHELVWQRALLWAGARAACATLRPGDPMLHQSLKWLAEREEALFIACLELAYPPVKPRPAEDGSAE